MASTHDSNIFDASPQHVELKLNKPIDNFELCGILLCIVYYHWGYTCWISLNEVVASDLKRLIDEFKQIQAGKALKVLVLIIKEVKN